MLHCFNTQSFFELRKVQTLWKNVFVHGFHVAIWFGQILKTRIENHSINANMAKRIILSGWRLLD